MFVLLNKNFSGGARLRDVFTGGLRGLEASGHYDQIIVDTLAGKYAKK